METKKITKGVGNMLNWERIKRTAIQSAAGAGIALITAVSQNWSKGSIIAACIQFVSTIAIAVLMNIKSQTEENDNSE